MFGTVMTIILAAYGVYYDYNIIHDLYFDKSGEVVVGERVDEKEVDIKDTLKDFAQYDAEEDSNKPSQQSSDSDQSEDEFDDDTEEISGGIEVDDLDRLIDECDSKGEGSLFAQITEVFTKEPAKAA